MDLEILNKVFGKYADSYACLCDNNTNKWLKTKDLLDYKNYFVFGDDGGDKFVNFFDNTEDLLKGVQKYTDGNTGADFETHIYLIVKDDVKQKIVVALAEDNS